MTKTPLLAILLFINLSALAQPKTEQEVRSLLCHKWKVTHMETAERKVAVPAEYELYMDIRSNGTLIELEPEGEHNGKWKYEHETRTFITDDDDGIKKHEVIKINEKEFIIKSDLGGELVNLIMKRVN